jgi:hypothetical protein
MIKPPSKTDEKRIDLDIGITDDKPDTSRAKRSPDAFGNAFAESSLGGKLDLVRTALDRVTSYDMRIAELTKPAPPILSERTHDLLFRDAAHERHVAAQRAADARHKAELKAADRRAGLADAMCDALMVRIQEFQDTLKPDEEVVVALANFGQHTTIHIETLTYQEPHLLVFDGAGPNGDQVRLLQHTSQTNVLLAKVTVAPGRPARRVGFRIATTESDSVEDSGDHQ